MAKKNETINYLTIDQALDLVDRIAKRAENFNYFMIESEKESMAHLLSEIGVYTSDLIDVSNMADNYAINAEIVTPGDYKNYNMKEVRENSPFSWLDENGDKYYCLNW